jgi:hypothetical protein
MLIGRPVVKKYGIGFVPHYVDQRLPAAVEFLERCPGVHFINVYQSPLSVLAEIAACDFVISSSLHGLVVADSFSVPNVRVRLSSGVIDELKFDDYYSAFNMTAPPPLWPEELPAIIGRIEQLSSDYKRPGLGDLQSALAKSFPVFS